jgi:hypothetical protein
MNFGWMVTHIDSLAAFLVFGVGTMAVTLVLAAVLLVRSGYLQRR